jgi:hypothetical protein
MEVTSEDSIGEARWRWVQDGADLVLCLDLADGLLLVTPNGAGSCDVRLTRQPLREVERLTQALAAMPAPGRVVLSVEASPALVAAPGPAVRAPRQGVTSRSSAVRHAEA